MSTLPNDLDTLMSRYEATTHKLPHELTRQDLDTIIGYHRQQRSRRASGERPSRPAKPTNESVLDLSFIKSHLKPAGPAVPSGFKRRV